MEKEGKETLLHHVSCFALAGSVKWDREAFFESV
jgi:hypothetical protein